MTTPEIETILRNPPAVKPPPDLLGDLQRQIVLPKAADSRSALPFWKQWFPALSFGVLVLGCIVALGVQINDLIQLKRENRNLQEQIARANASVEAQPNTAAESVLSTPEQGEIGRVRAEVEQLRAEHAQLEEQLNAEQPLKAVAAWSLQINGASALTAGEWEPGAPPKVLVADRNKQLHIIGADGAKAVAIPVPEVFEGIEVGRHMQDGPRLVGYEVWGKQVTVIDRTGKTLWTYKSGSGVDGAHWGDFDGDGTDELVIGMNGSDGLHAVSADGKLLWQHGLGNVWNQAIVPATASEPAHIFATEAGGTVKVFDPQGKLLRTLRPGGQYVSPMTAARIDGTSVQVIAAGPGKGGGTMAFDETGKIAWSSSTGLGHDSWRSGSFAHGDVDGDGREDWCFLNAQKELVVATARGERLASVPSQQGLESLALVRAQPNSRPLLMTLKGDTVQCHRFE